MRKSHSKERCYAIQEGRRTGKKPIFTKERKERTSKRLTGNKFRVGHRHSEETKRQMRDTRLRKGLNKLKDMDVLEIRRCLNNGEKVVDLALLFDVTKAHIYHIKNRKTWRHI